MVRLLTVMSTLALALGLVAPAGQAAPDERNGFVQQGAGPSAPPTAVTLVTGDEVHVTELPGGRRTVDITPAPREGRAPSFFTVERGGDLHVIPEDVRALVPTRLDPALFNITELVEHGYDDASRDALPLIVTGRDQLPTGVPAAEVTERLESIDGTGVRVEKDDADELGSALAGLAANSGHASRTRRSGPLDGVEKIWLNRKVTVDLDESTGQIGAPAAWDAGLDGTGVTVAVLDSGIDATHPDLAGRVAGERNFTLTPTASDGLGHGTHVASIIAGGAQASDGRYRGVADGVQLLNAKVLNDHGIGYMSWIIDGMEWAAAEQDADIVNMSLGVRGLGADPMTDAVDTLTDEHGTLFVVAAGNDGCDECISHPADAAAALTVGAVDRSDSLADFSSRGPLPETFGIKPDVTAPGVGIVAARAAGTSMGTPVDADYTGASGTSMATPHVAGAAALLLQAEPTLGPEQLKAWLMNTATPNRDNTVYEQGAGRIDVADAVGSGVFAAPGSVSFGHYRWPHAGRSADRRTVTYQNRTGADVVLDLAVRVTSAAGAAPPPGTLRVSAPTVTVPANGTATVELVLDTARGEPGLYGGYLAGEAADGTTVRTPVGYNQESKRVELRVKGIARDGRPAEGYASILDVEDGSVHASRNLAGDPSAPCTDEPSGPSTCVRVPPGTYSVLGYVDTMPTYEQSGAFVKPLNRSLVGDPEIEVTEDTEVVLDARKATEVVVDTPDHETKRNLGAATHIMFHRAPEEGTAVNAGYSMYAGEMLEERLFMQPTEQVTTGEFSAYTRWRLEAPKVTLEVTAPEDLELHPKYYRKAPFSDFSWQFPELEGDLDTEIVDAGLGRADDVAGLDLDGKVALIQRSDSISVAEQSNNAADAGAAFVAIYNDVPGVNSDPWPANVRLEVPTTWISHEEGEQVLALLADGPVDVSAHGTTTSPYLYDLVYAEDGSIPADLHYVASTDELARVETRFHSQLADEMSLAEARHQFQPWEQFSIGSRLAVDGAPRTRVDYVTPGSSTRWSQTVSTPEPPYNYIWPHDPTAHIHLSSGELRSYEAGGQYRQSWFEQPLTPGVNPFLPATRTGDIVEVAMSAVAGRGNFGDVYTSMFDEGLETDFRVYRGDDYIGGTKYLAVGWFRAAPEPARYRIEYDIDNNTPWARLSTSTRSVWTFTTQPPAPGEKRVEPMLLVDYDVDVDLQNRAPHPRDRKGPHQIGINISHPAGAAQVPLDEVELAVSYDDGQTWKDVRNIHRREEGRYVARLSSQSAEHGNGFVSLRLSASDTAGNTVEQEIIRAYALSHR